MPDSFDISIQTFRNQLDNQKHDATEHQRGEEECGSWHAVNQHPCGYIQHNVNGCWNEAVEVDVSIQVTSIERETVEDHGDGHPAEIQNQDNQGQLFIPWFVFVNKNLEHDLEPAAFRKFTLFLSNTRQQLNLNY